MPKPSPNHDAAASIVRTLRNAGHTAYFAGGCVRDELLGLAPEDYDVATDAIPPRIAELFPRSNHVGAAFGVMLVSVGRSVVEVATFRADGSYTDKRRPDSVTFSDPVADAQRRDFTVNALFLDPTRPGQELAPGVRSSGAIIDHVGGLDDLRARVLRAVGDPEKRLAEDHLRALRAARLAAKLGFQIEPGTAAAIRRHASELAGVSRERIGDELRKMFTHRTRARAAALIVELGLDVPIAGPLLGARTHTMLSGLPGEALFTTALAGWAFERGLSEQVQAITELASRWRDAMCLSNEERAGLEQTLRHFVLLRQQWAGLGVAPQKRAAARPGFDAALCLLQIADAPVASEVQRRLEQLRCTPSGLSPVPLVTGDDLVAAGLLPGPRFKHILDGVYDAQLEDRIASREGALTLARQLAARA